MSENLKERLYAKQQQNKPNHNILRPKNSSQIAPNLILNKTKETENPAIPTLVIPVDISNRPQSTLSKDTFRSNRTQITLTNQQLENTPRLNRPNTSLEEYKYNDSNQPMTYRPSFFSNNENILKETEIIKPISRAKPPNLIPQEIRPTSALESNTSRITSKLNKPLSTNRNFEPIENTPRSVFRLKKSNLKVQTELDLIEFKKSSIYTPLISDETWNDPNLIFYYIRLMKQNNLDEEFLYFHSTPSTNTEPENVYFLRVIPPNEVNWDDYYTLSQKGVTIYKFKKVEFRPLDIWIRECIIFITMKDIPFFNLYSKCRSFSLLKSISRNQIIQKSKLKLTNNLFFVNSILRKSILDLQRSCDRILRLSLVDLKSTRTLTLNQFIDFQKQNVDLVIQIIKHQVELARVSIVQACDVTYETTGSSADIMKSKKKIETISEKKEKIEIKQFDKVKKDKSNIKKNKDVTKNKNKKVIQTSEMMVYTQLATQRFCYKNLARFIRLCDNILIQNIYQLFYQSYLKLLEFLSPRLNSSGGDITKLSIELIINNN